MLLISSILEAHLPGVGGYFRPGEENTGARDSVMKIFGARSTEESARSIFTRTLFWPDSTRRLLAPMLLMAAPFWPRCGGWSRPQSKT